MRLRVLFIGYFTPVLVLTQFSMSVYGLVTRAMEKEYANVLGKLFKPVKLAPRHSVSAPTVSELFSSRKKVFSDLYSKTSLCGSCSVVHVAGTKGKGSAVEYISSSLIGNGNSVGIFTSPHMHTARERVKVNRELIAHSDMIRLGNEVLAELSPQPWVVFFDLLLALAVRYFNEKNVQYMILESGIGGRYDTTNFVDNPAACVITSISLDHQALLGDTVEEIAYQKAGIIKPKSHVFTPASQVPTVLEVFRKECLLQDATLHVVPVGREYLVTEGVHCTTEVQVENACLSRAVLKHLNVESRGWEKFYWPCRMERLQYAGHTVVLDGCHNGDSMERFLKGLRSTYEGKRIVVLFGAGHDKCLTDMMDRLFVHADQVLMVQSKHFRAHSEAELLQRVPQGRAHILDATVHGVQDLEVGEEKEAVNVPRRHSLGERLQHAVEKNDPKEVVIAVCGSLFVAAEAREHIFSQDPSLFSENDWVRQCDPDIPM